MDRRVGLPVITNSREDTRIYLMDHTTTSRALNQKMGQFERQQVSA